MSYTVLARRYRSHAFDAVVGQEAIVNTLQNAIRQGRIAHAYLFTGTRGVGKTSTARLFARALNAPDTLPGCPKPPALAGEEPFEYPPLEVQQRMADAIMRGDDLNVIEIDGASNNSVENSRSLIANASLAPTANARFKVYIIDEVHMLTTAAFNALLKTMEEPPAHVKFILCTTETHKVPTTIQSRCQRFDFKNIPVMKVQEHLAHVLAQENITAEPEVVWQVARMGNGSMRDALSLMERMLATGEQPLTVKLLVEMLGLPPQDRVVSLVDALADSDIAKALETAGLIMDQGVSQDQLLEVLIDRFRTLMLVRVCGVKSPLVELPTELQAPAQAQAQKFDASGLAHMIALCENLQRHAKNSSSPRALLDATLVRLAMAEKMADIAALVAGQAGSVKKK